jgi:hypothetical protein
MNLLWIKESQPLRNRQGNGLSQSATPTYEPINPSGLTPGYWEFKIRRSTLLGIVASLLFHGLLLLVVIRHPVPLVPTGGLPPLEVRLNDWVPPQPARKPVPKVAPAQPRPHKAQPQRTHPATLARRIIAVDKAVPHAPPLPIALTPLPEPHAVPTPPTPETSDAPPTDMASYIQAQRAKRAEAEHGVSGPTPDQVSMANIQRNLKIDGTNGVFQILSMGVRQATFSFRGWTNDYSNAKRQVIEVDAGVGGDVERAVVQRMITLIRGYYKGDFNWQSQRLNKVVVLSARPDDNSGLEAFLMKEFFRADGSQR